MKNRKIKWLRVLAIITSPLWFVPMIALAMIAFLLLAVIDTVTDLYKWCVESDTTKQSESEHVEQYYPDDDD
jgi:hypothetical protein